MLKIISLNIDIRKENALLKYLHYRKILSVIFPENELIIQCRLVGEINRALFTLGAVTEPVEMRSETLEVVYRSISSRVFNRLKGFASLLN